MNLHDGRPCEWEQSSYGAKIWLLDDQSRLEIRTAIGRRGSAHSRSLLLLPAYSRLCQLRSLKRFAMLALSTAFVGSSGGHVDEDERQQQPA